MNDNILRSAYISCAEKESMNQYKWELHDNIMLTRRPILQRPKQLEFELPKFRKFRVTDNTSTRISRIRRKYDIYKKKNKHFEKQNNDIQEAYTRMAAEIWYYNNYLSYLTARVSVIEQGANIYCTTRESFGVPHVKEKEPDTAEYNSNSETSCVCFCFQCPSISIAKYEDEQMVGNNFKKELKAVQHKFRLKRKFHSVFSMQNK